MLNQVKKQRHSANLSGSVLLAVVQFLYFAYVDNGYLLSSFSRMLSSEEGKQLVTQYGMSKRFGLRGS